MITAQIPTYKRTDSAIGIEEQSITTYHSTAIIGNPIITKHVTWQLITRQTKLDANAPRRSDASTAFPHGYTFPKIHPARS
ncbi:hypothetical protein FHL15_010804 [Xylaria flabelliformis]|uniref:Uncharacterized protein n=1 Tax=Xylaria flabelliformis TaxID=2512241 RepID=A0A553HK21_9PEZI|nr:hypothetical protein FHL15_010804 [Xylaria flabelliformis]